MWKQPAHMFLLILTMGMNYTEVKGDSKNAQLEALEDIKEEAVDKVKQKEAESMSESLVKSYELILKAAPEAGRSAYIACVMRHKSWNEKTANKVEVWGDTTVTSCIWKCWELRQRFAGLLYGDQCWCMNVIRGLTEVEDKHCSAPCFGNKTQVCGGSNRYSIYYTGYIEEPMYTHITHKDIDAGTDTITTEMINALEEYGIDKVTRC